MKKDELPNDKMEHGTVSLRNTLNELTGAEWLYFTKSMLTTTYPSAHEQKLEYSIKE